MCYQFHYSIFLACLLVHFTTCAAQNRIGYINQYSSDAECREYFRKNILNLDPIEGIYQVETYCQETNMYRKFPVQKLETSKVVIYKDDSGVFQVSNNVTINRIGETSFYNYVVNWKEAKGEVTTTRFSYNGIIFEVTHEVPQVLVNRNLSQNYINANTKVFFTHSYVKEYPTHTMYQEAIRQSVNIEKLENWSGTGFALQNGYVVTNYHVIENAQEINIQGVNGDFSQKYEASIIATDKYNDLAILHITDAKFYGFKPIPYNLKTALSEVGEEIFVLGYPLISTMGDEIKLTTGIISSRTGFQGNVSLYQISAPIQPGNSGGPLFDNKGNLIGIVNAKHKGTENVGYAIKTSCLKNLVESSISTSILPRNNQTARLPLTEKVKQLKNFVFMISCSSVRSSSNYTSNNHGSKNENGDIDIISPQISNTSSKNKGLKIKRVQITLAQTIIDLEYDNSINNSEWITISPNTYIVSYNTGKKYTMTMAEGIPIEPRKYNLTSQYEKVQFRLIFPALPKNTTQFNLIESENSSWKFYGIKLR